MPGSHPARWRLFALLLLLPLPRLAAQAPPPARREPVADRYFGEEVADPYRWLERESDERSRWLTAQDRAARAFAAAYPGRDAIRDRIREAALVDRFSPIAVVGDRLYVMQADGSFTRRSMLELGPGGKVRTVVAADDLPAQARLVRAQVSPDGRYLVYGISRDGASITSGSWLELRIRDLRRDMELPERLTGLHGGRSSIALVAGAPGFYYERLPLPPPDSVLTARVGQERLYYHRFGTPQSDDRLVYTPTGADLALATSATADGRFLVVTEGTAGAVENRVLFAPLTGAPAAGLRVLVDSADAAYLPLGGAAGELWFQTTSGAPRWRVIGVDTRAPARARWREIVPQAEDPIEPTIGAAALGGRLLVAYRHDAWLRVRSYDPSGGAPQEIALPRVGSVWTGFVGAQDQPTALYTLSDFADPGTLYALDLRSGTSRVVRRPSLAYDPDQFVTAQVFYPAADGTRIPMFLSWKRQPGDPPGQPPRARPTIIYGYGAFSWSAAPWFRPDLVAWMSDGGVFALPNIRGGGEYGEEWHQAAVGVRKQLAIDDYLAAAAWLVAQGHTPAGQLVGNGGSASGALVGAALTQRPDLFQAVTLDYPALDMLRLEEYTGGRAWRPEFGSTADREQFRALRRYSPYHNLKPGTCYPATLILPGELDQTTVPMHGYKFAAALQRAQGCDRPVLLRVSWGAGHAAGANLEDSIENWADQQAFLWRVLGAPRSSE